MDITRLLDCSQNNGRFETPSGRRDTPSGDSQDGDSVDSDAFWGQPTLQEGAFDYSLQRWYDEPKKFPKFPPVPVTDLQSFSPGKTGEELTGSRSKTKPCADRLKKRMFIPAGVQLEIPNPVTAMDGAAVRESEIFDKNHNHQYAYAQAAIEEVTPQAEILNENFSENTQRIYDALFDTSVTKQKVEKSEANESVRDPNVMLADNKRTTTRKTMDNKGIGRYYPPSNLPKLNFRFGKTSNAASEPRVQTQRAVEDDWAPNGWTIEDGGWIADPSFVGGRNQPDINLIPSESIVLEGDEPSSPELNSNETLVLPFPQDDFCTTLTDQFPVKHEKEAENITKKLTDQNARFHVALPSGATLRVPVAAIKMFDHGLPDTTVTGHGVTFADLKQKIQEKQEQLKKVAAELIDDRTLDVLQTRPSMLLKQQKYADLIQSRPLHEPSDVGEIREMQFACAPVDDDAFQNDTVYQKLDLSEIIQTEQLTGNEDYTTLKRIVKETADPPPAPVKQDTTNLDKHGSAHECVRQYWNDYKMDAAAQKLSQEWWLHHDAWCHDLQHNIEPFDAEKQYFDLAERHRLLIREYKIAKVAEKKKSRLVNQGQLNLRFMNMNFKRYAAKNAKLQKDLEIAKQNSPSHFKKVAQEKDRITVRFKGTRQLNRDLHKQLHARRVQVGQLVHKLENHKALLKYRQSRKAHPDDSRFPDYQGLNPMGFLCRKKPAQLLKLTGMSIQQKTPAHTRAINAMSINPYRHMAITVGADGHWRAWDVKAMGKSVYEGTGHSGSIYRTEYHPSGSFFATAGLDAVVNFWNTEDGTKRLKVKHLHPVAALSFHSSGDFMLTGCNNGALSLWDLNSQRCLSHLCQWNGIDLVHKGAIANCQIIQHSNICITGSEDGDVRLWDLRTESNRIIMGQSAPIRNAKVALNGHIMGTTSKYDAEVKLWDLRKLGQLISVANYSPQFICDFNFDTSCHLVAFALNNGQVNFWDMKTGTTIVYPAHNSATTVVTWDVWGEYLLSGDEQGNIFLWS